MSKLYFIVLCFLLNYGVLSYTVERKAIVEDAIEQNLGRISLYSLNRFGWSIYSQYGEEGIIEEIFSRIGIENGFFVEFGAADGIFCSNTRYLWEKGWKGVMIEADSKLFQNLVKTYQGNSDVLPLNYFIKWKKEQPGLFFDEIKRLHFPDTEIDFLSIDVDGCDYFIFKTLACRPKVICIENGLKWHPLLDKEVPESIAKNNLHQSFKVLIDYARSVGYEPVCSTINLFFVRKDFYSLFKETPSDPVTLWRDAFRAFPYKKYWIDCRNKTYPDIKKFENGVYETIMPITEDS